MLRSFIRFLQKLPWSLRSKLAASFGLVLLGFIVNALLSFWLLSNIQAAQSRLSSSSLYLERLSLYTLAYESELGLYSDAIYIKAPFVQDNFKSTIRKNLADGYGQPRTSAQEAFEREFSSQYNTLYDHFSTLSDNLTQGDINQAKANWQKFQPDFNKLKNLLKTRQAELEAERSYDQDGLQNTLALSNTLLIIVSIISVVMAISLLWLLTRVLIEPLKRLEQALRAVAKGDLDQKLTVANRDEIGSLAQSFQQAVDALQQVLKGVQISQHLRDLSNELTLLSQQQAAGSTHQVSALTQVTAAMQELGHTAAFIAESASQVADLCNNNLLLQINEVTEAEQDSLETTYQVVTVVENTLSHTEKIGQQIEYLHYQMDSLHVQAQSIDKVVNLLNQLAGEVRMVALNASIEAASAGQYGSRFKKVAVEVRDLATRASEAAVQAREIINSVQTSTQLTRQEVENSQVQLLDIIESNQQVRPRLQALKNSSHKVGETVNILLTVASQVNEQSQQIKHTTYQQRQSSQDAILSARSVGNVAVENETASRQLAINSHHLENLTDQLTEVLGQVRFGV